MSEQSLWSEVDIAELEDMPQDIAPVETTGKSGERTCSVCGETGHNARSHNEDGTVSDKPKRKQRSGSISEVKASVQATYMLIGGIWSMRDQQCGPVVTMIANDASDAWAEAAKQNPRLKEWILQATSATGWVNLLVAHLPLIVAIKAHHIDTFVEQRRAEQEAEEEAIRQGWQDVAA